MTTVPTDIQAIREEGVVRVSWGERHADFPFTYLRGKCTCAMCVDEWTGAQILDPASIPADISIKKMELVGGYAVRIHWSDDHNSGLYTWERLSELRQGNG